MSDVFKDYPTTIKDYDTWCRRNNKAIVVSSGLYRGIRSGYVYKDTFLNHVDKGKMFFFEFDRVKQDG